MKNEIKNKVIVIGGDHHNTLGVIRSLGKKGIRTYLIVIGNKISHVSKSKYIARTWAVEKDESKVINILEIQFNNEKYKPIIVPTADFAVHIIDKNLAILNEKYIIPNAANAEGKVCSLMNKDYMSKIARESGHLTPRNWTIKLTFLPFKVPNDMKYPCIVKPINSVVGKKDEIIKCTDLIELQNCLTKLREKHKLVFVQEYIKKDAELGIVGCVTLKNKEIIMPGVIKKIREYPLGSGSSSYAMISNDFRFIDTEAVTNFLRKIGYSGIFDMEFLRAGDKTYFLEINFRNGGNGYALTKSGVNIIYQWCLEALGVNISQMKKKVDRTTYFMMDTRDFRHILEGNLTFIKWIKDLIKTKAFLFVNFTDIRPCISKIFSLKNKLIKYGGG